MWVTEKADSATVMNWYVRQKLTTVAFSHFTTGLVHECIILLLSLSHTANIHNHTSSPNMTHLHTHFMGRTHTTLSQLPEMPSHYSADLCDLIRQMLAQAADNRPSVQELLRMHFVRQHIKHFLQKASQKKAWVRCCHFPRDIHCEGINNLVGHWVVQCACRSVYGHFVRTYINIYIYVYML